jgi:hypothetical protein
MNLRNYGLGEVFFLVYTAVVLFVLWVILLSIWRIGVAMRDISETLRRMESRRSAPTSDGQASEV